MTARVSAEQEAGDHMMSDLKIEFGKIARQSKFSNDTMSIWGGSLVKGKDGLYHMLYSRWPKSLGWAWVTHSEIAHAVSESPFGPFTFRNTALPPRGPEYWDGMCTHNPNVHCFEGKYYLYYMGNTGDGKVKGIPGKRELNWLHRNNQRIGVAIADTPDGPWQRFDRPVLDITPDRNAPDSLMTSNPAVCQRPDGGYLMVYKAVGQQYDLPAGGPVVHCVATADSPTGPFIKKGDPVFTVEGARFPAEDPYIWYQAGKYRAIVKRIRHTPDGSRAFSLVQYESEDGLDWQPAKYRQVSDRTVTWEDGRSQQFPHLERPQVYIEDGQPIALLCAADTIDKDNVRHAFNVQIPLKITEE